MTISMTGWPPTIASGSHWRPRHDAWAQARHPARRAVADGRRPRHVEAPAGSSRHHGSDRGAEFLGHVMKLVWPSREYLPGYIAALERGWSPDNLRGLAAAREELERIARDADAFLASLVDSEATSGPITLPDGTRVPRLPGYRRWLWDGEFCGSIVFRWQRGTEALPSYCLGHIGYSVVPWKQRRGYATRALREVLRDAKAEGLRYVEITTAPDNVPSQRGIEANGGVFVEEFITPPTLGSKRERRYRVNLWT